MSSKRDILSSPRPSVFTPILRRWFTDERTRELQERRELYDAVRKRYAASPWAGEYPKCTSLTKFVDTVKPVVDEAAAHLPEELQNALYSTWADVLRLEDVLYDLPEWPASMTMKEAVKFREALRAQEYFLANDERCSAELIDALLLIFTVIAQELPKSKAKEESSSLFRLSTCSKTLVSSRSTSPT